MYSCYTYINTSSRKIYARLQLSYKSPMQAEKYMEILCMCYVRWFSCCCVSTFLSILLLNALTLYKKKTKIKANRKVPHYLLEWFVFIPSHTLKTIGYARNQKSSVTWDDLGFPILLLQNTMKNTNKKRRI